MTAAQIVTLCVVLGLAAVAVLFYFASPELRAGLIVFAGFATLKTMMGLGRRR